MGGAIVRGLVESNRLKPDQITVVDPSSGAREAMEKLGVNTQEDAVEGTKGADVILLAVKPWLIQGVTEKIASSVTEKMLVGSVAAGIDFDKLGPFECRVPLFRIVPNTAVSVREGVTFITALNASPEQRQLMVSLFEPLGMVMEIPKEQIPAATALASCGIAFALRYARAAMEGGVEMGIAPATGQRMIAQTLIGAAALLLQPGSHPETEIDRVTTPGGITIRGLNTMEALGFTRAVIEGLKVSR